MKKIFTPLLISSVMLFANTNELSWVDEQVDAIKPPRDGESIRNISKVKDPFIFLKKNSTKDTKKDKSSLKKAVVANKTKKESSGSKAKATAVFTKNSFVLGAIINNSALINGNWYNVGEVINGYKISNIDKKTVNLNNGSKTKVLSTATINPKIKFK